MASTVLVLGGLYLLALVIRLLAVGQLPFPVFEPSAYYAAVAGNLVRGEGLVTHAVWSFATPPLEVPKPAFTLWQPMSSLISALAMSALGPTYWSAQVAGAAMGALLAPMAWALGHQSARLARLDARRAGAVALASGLLGAILGPFVLASAVPDSYTPFTVFAVSAALLMPGALGLADDSQGEPTWRTQRGRGLALGLTLGLAYLSRQEAVWLGLTVLIMLAWGHRSRPAGARRGAVLARLWPVILGASTVVLPWLAYNAVEVGSAFPGQAVENMFLVRNEDIYAFLERPTAERYLAQGPATLLSNPIAAAIDGLVSVVLLPAFPIGLLGLAGLVSLHRSPALRRPSALTALLVCGGLTFLGTVLIFPVATRWGTFMHASGPLLVALTVVAALTADAALARISRLRGWRQPNIVLGPLTLVAVTVVLSLLQVSLLSSQSEAGRSRYETLAARLSEVAAGAGTEVPATLITDRPMWLSEAVGRQAVALPDEGLGSIMALSRQFAAPWVVVVEERGRYPAAFLDPSARACLAELPVEMDTGGGSAWLFKLADTCPEA
jgi:hypothetical protein